MPGKPTIEGTTIPVHEYEVMKQSAEFAHDNDKGYAILLRIIAKKLREPFDDTETLGEGHKRHELRLRVEGIADFAERIEI